MRKLLFILFFISNLHAQDSETLSANPAEDLFDLAALYYQEATEAKNPETKKTNFKLSATKFDNYLRSYPKGAKAAEAWFFLGMAYRNLGENEPAEKCFASAVQSGHPKFSPAAADLLATAAYKAEDWAEAARWFLALAKSTQTDQVRHEALARRALCLEKLGNQALYRTALHAVRDDPGNPHAENATLNLARLLQTDNKKTDALALYAELTTSKDKALRADAILQSAILSRDLGKTADALRWFNAALDEPSLKDLHGAAQLAVMEINFKAKNYEQTLAALDRGRPTLKGKAAIQRLIFGAKSLDALDRSDEANKLYAEIDRLSPDLATGFEAGYRVVSQAYNSKDKNFIKSAENFLKQYAAEKKDDSRLRSVRLMLASRYYEDKKYADALRQYEALDLAKVDPKNLPDIRYAISLCRYSLKKDQATLDALSAFLSNHPTDPRSKKTLLRRAETLTAMDSDQAALEDYRTLLFDNPPKDLKILILQRASQIYQKAENYPRFIANQKALLNIAGLPDQTVASVHFWIGWDHYRKKEYPEAVTSLELARKISPDQFTTEVAPMLVRTAYFNEDLAKLRSELDLALKADPNIDLPAPLFRWLGATLAKDEKFAEAWPYLEKGMSKPDPANPPSPVHWHLYADTATATGHHAAALQAANAILATAEHPFRKAEALYTKSRALLGLRKLPEATTAASEALALRPQGQLDFDLRIHSGDIALASNDPEEAARLYVMAAKLFTQNETQKSAAYQKAVKALEAIGTQDAETQAAQYRKLIKH